jgi:hypothetical protein
MLHIALQILKRSLDIFFKMKKAAAEDFITRYSRTNTELRDTIVYLILHREQVKDQQICRLEMESQRLTDKLNDIDRKKLSVELECFKEILALQKRLIKQNDRQRR